MSNNKIELGNCPVCNRGCGSGETPMVEGSNVTQECTCIDCGAVWLDTYRIVSSTVMVVGSFALDGDGNQIKVGDSVDVCEPTADDLWSHEFSGTVAELYINNGLAAIQVEDGDGDSWDMYSEQVIKSEY